VAIGKDRSERKAEGKKGCSVVLHPFSDIYGVESVLMQMLQPVKEGLDSQVQALIGIEIHVEPALGFNGCEAMAQAP
jgi:hypothetical protein